jgi:prevent-host-death family protein
MLKIADGLIPIGAFKAQAKKYLAQLAKRSSPLLITQNGKEAAVIMSPTLYDKMYTAFVRQGIQEGLADAAAGRTTTMKEGMASIDAAIEAKWPKASHTVRAKAAKVVRRKPSR